MSGKILIKNGFINTVDVKTFFLSIDILEGDVSVEEVISNNGIPHFKIVAIELKKPFIIEVVKVTKLSVSEFYGKSLEVVRNDFIPPAAPLAEICPRK